MTDWKSPWCWERLKVGGKGADRGWDGWMASPTRWTWVWVSSGSCWWTGRPGMLQSMGSQWVGHEWATELNWTGGFFKHFTLNLVLQWYFYLKGFFSSQEVILCLTEFYNVFKNLELTQVFSSGNQVQQEERGPSQLGLLFWLLPGSSCKTTLHVGAFIHPPVST